MNRITVSFALVLLVFLSARAHADTGMSPIRQMEVQTVDVAIPEMLLAELRRQPDKITSIKAVMKIKASTADSRIVTLVDHKDSP